MYIHCITSSKRFQSLIFQKNDGEAQIKLKTLRVSNDDILSKKVKTPPVIRQKAVQFSYNELIRNAVGQFLHAEVDGGHDGSHEEDESPGRQAQRLGH